MLERERHYHDQIKLGNTGIYEPTHKESAALSAARTKQLLLLHWWLFKIRGLCTQMRWTEHAECGYFISTYKFCPKTYSFFWSRETEVGIVIRLETRQPSNRISITGKGKRLYSSPKSADRLHLSSYKMGTGGRRAVSPRLKRPGRTADYSPHLVKTLGMSGATLLRLHTQFHNIYREKFTFDNYCGVWILSKVDWKKL